MKKRSTEILQKVMKYPSRSFSIPGFAKEYGVSQRTLRNDINEINEFLESIGSGPVLISTDGALLLDSSCDRRGVLDELFRMDTYAYKLSSEERQIFLLCSLLCSNTYISMQEIADELYVSRISVLNDLQLMQAALAEMEIYVISNSGKGMKLICSLRQRIDLMMMIYERTTANVENGGFFQSFIFKRMQIRFSFSEILEYLLDYINDQHMFFVDDVLHEFAVFLFALMNVPDQIDEKKRSKTLQNSQALEGLDRFLVMLGEKLGTRITENMLLAYQTFIREHDIHSFLKTIDEMELYKIIHYYLAEIDREMHLHLNMDSMLIDSLLLHIKNMKNWGGYAIELPEADNVAVDYEMLQKCVEKHASILERYLGYTLSDNMKKSIVIHICVALIRNQRNMSRLSVAVVCPGSMATGKYLESQLRNYFDFRILGVISSNQVFRRLRERNEQVDLIISTVPLNSDEYIVLTVHPSLTMEDLNLIQETSFLCQKEKDKGYPRTKTQRLLRRMKNLIEDKEIPPDLRTEMETLVDAYATGVREQPRFEAIGELLLRDHIDITYENLTWRDAMRMAARPLEEKGYIDPSYIEESIRNVEQYGDYIVIGEGIALAHANAKSGVHRDCLSLLVCPTGIPFSDGERIVFMIFCFASTGEREYIQLLKEIMAISEDERFFKKLIDMSEYEICQALQ